MTSSATASSTGRRYERRGAGAARPGSPAAPRVAVAVDSDTGQLLRAEQPGRPDEQDRDHHDVGDDVAEPAAQEQEVVLVTGGEGLGDADEQPADQRAAGRVQ